MYGGQFYRPYPNIDAMLQLSTLTSRRLCGHRLPWAEKLTEKCEAVPLVKREWEKICLIGHLLNFSGNSILTI